MINYKRSFSVFVCILALAGTAFSVSPQKAAGTIRSSKQLRAMARVYMACGRYEKAAPLAEQALMIAESTNSPGELSSSLIDLAYLYNDQGRISEAEQMCTRGLALQESIYGADHEFVAYTLRILGSIYRKQAQYDHSGTVLERAIDIINRHNQNDERVVAPFKVDLAKLLLAKGDLEGAKACYLDTIGLLNSTFGPNHLYTATIFGQIARLYAMEGNFADAEPLIENTLAVQEEVYGDAGNWSMASTWVTMAMICRSKGDYQQAANLCQKALETLQTAFSNNHPDIAEVLDTMAALYRDTGQPAEAANLLQRASDIRASIQSTYKPVAKVME